MRFFVIDDAGWRRWFAWHPVRIGYDWVWLEWLEREFVPGVGDSAVYYRFPVKRTRQP